MSIRSYPLLALRAPWLAYSPASGLVLLTLWARLLVGDRLKGPTLIVFMGGGGAGSRCRLSLHLGVQKQREISGSALRLTKKSSDKRNAHRS